MRRKEVLTTGEVARICHVAPRTVSKWFDTGKLPGYRIPGSRDRRIPLNQLIQFMRVHGMPMRELEGNTIRILVVDGVTSAATNVAEELDRADRYDVRTAANGFEAGMVAGSFHPHVIFVDVLDEAVDAGEMVRNIRANPDLAATRICAVTNALTSGQSDSLVREGFDLILRRPFDINDLLAVVEEAADLIS